jgi:beta-lactamase superfamily II metal-dependent hydrolase
MPATDVSHDLLGDPGVFVAACRPTDLIYFTLNVGDGDTQLLLLPEHTAGRRRCVIVDCIRASKMFTLIDALAEAGLLVEVSPLIALVVATHPHDDHISGMAALLRRFGDGQIEELWEPGYYHPSAAYLEMMRELEDHDIRHLQPASGTSLHLGMVKLTVLAPGVALRSRFDSYGVNINNASIALKVEFPAARTLERDAERAYLRLPSMQTLILGADAQTLSWGQVLIDFPQLGPTRTAVTTALRRARGTEPLSAQVFKVPHHGSKHGLNLELVEAIKPAVSIVSSVHDGGKYHFPHTVTQAALREAIDPISSKPEEFHKSDIDLNILYTGSQETDGDTVIGPLGTVALLVGAGGRREIWRFGDEPADAIDLANGRPMRPPKPAAGDPQPLPAIPRHRGGTP